MAQSCPSSIEPFAPITLDAPFGEAASNVTTSLPHLALVPSLPPPVREAPTQPAVPGDSWTADPEPGSGIFGKNPEWCIDLGDEMIALHAVELYARLATGQIPGEAPVWRVGREAWTPARDVPELRYAVDDATPSGFEGDRQVAFEEDDAVALEDAARAFDDAAPFVDDAPPYGDDPSITIDRPIACDGDRPSLDEAIAFAQAG